MVTIPRKSKRHPRISDMRARVNGRRAPLRLPRLAEMLADSVVCPRRRANAHQGLKPCSFSLRAEARTWPDGRCAHIAYAAAAPRFTSLLHHDLRRACTSVLNVGKPLLMWISLLSQLPQALRNSILRYKDLSQSLSLPNTQATNTEFPRRFPFRTERRWRPWP